LSSGGVKPLLIIAVVALFAQTGLVRAAEVQRRGSGTFHLGDWPKKQRNFDIPPAGMSDFLSRLSYPNSLRRQHVQGVMLVDVSLDAAGRLLAIRVLHSVHPALDRIVIDALRARAGLQR
jgi:TonB family protein